MEGILPEEVAPHGKRLLVNRYNQMGAESSIFAIGDIAYMETPKYPRAHPQLANVAINQALLLAKNLKRLEQGKPMRPFEYVDMGSMATVGTNKALVDFPYLHFRGLVAWVIWMFLHLMLILGVRNKLVVFVNWAWAYVTKDTSLRLILSRPDDRQA